MKLHRKKLPKDKGICQMTDACQEPAVVAGCCAACYSWWRNIQLFTPAQLVRYRWRIKRFAGRVEDKLSNRTAMLNRPKLRRVK